MMEILCFPQDTKWPGAVVMMNIPFYLVLGGTLSCHSGLLSIALLLLFPSLNLFRWHILVKLIPTLSFPYLSSHSSKSKENLGW